MPPAEVRYRVTSTDIDASDIMHFTRYVSLLEPAVLALLGLNGDAPTSLQREGLDVRVRELHLQYRRAVRSDDVLTFNVWPEHIGIGRVRMRTVVHRDRSDADTDLIMSGWLELAFVDLRSEAPVALPDRLRQSLAAAPGGSDHS